MLRAGAEAQRFCGPPGIALPAPEVTRIRTRPSPGAAGQAGAGPRRLQPGHFPPVSAMRGPLLRLLRPRRASPRPLLVSGSLWGRAQTAAVSQAYSTQAGGTMRPTGRYPIPNKKDLPYDIVELMEEVEVKSGFLPNVFSVLSHRPAEFRAFFAYYNAIMNKQRGSLSKADKELIVVATSVVNRCPYCVIAHGALHRIYSKKPALADQVVVNWKLADLSEREQAMLEFALAVSHADNITEEHFQKLEAQGFDREDAWDIGTIASFFAMSNRIAHFTDLRPNEEFYTMGRIPQDKEKAGTL